jgi:hypothetical protein
LIYGQFESRIANDDKSILRNSRQAMKAVCREDLLSGFRRMDKFDLATRMLFPRTMSTVPKRMER